MSFPSPKSTRAPTFKDFAGLVKHSQLSPSICFKSNSSQCAPVFSLMPSNLAGITLVLFLTKTSPGFK